MISHNAAVEEDVSAVDVQRLNVTDFKQNVLVGQERRKRVYDGLLDKVVQRAYQASQLGLGQCECVVPIFQLGTPPYDVLEAVQYITARLAARGFGVTAPMAYQPNRLVISWDGGARDGIGDHTRAAPTVSHPTRPEPATTSRVAPLLRGRGSSVFSKRPPTRSSTRHGDAGGGRVRFSDAAPKVMGDNIIDITMNNL